MLAALAAQVAVAVARQDRTEWGPQEAMPQAVLPAVPEAQEIMVQVGQEVRRVADLVLLVVSVPTVSNLGHLTGAAAAAAVLAQ